VPFNIASYSLLIHMMAHETGLKPGQFLHSITDAHIYSNHVEQVKEQLSRTPYDMPVLGMNKKSSIFDYKMEDFWLENYKHHSAISAPMAQ
jgi:thymidylate synthase